MINLKNVKTIICGIQGSGKTQLALHLTRQFKKPVWYLVHEDDLKYIPSHVAVVKAEKRNLSELNEVIGSIIALAKQNKVDAIFIDEMDLFIVNNMDITEYNHINDLFINHRHYGLAVIGITRRPQDVGTKYVESCEHIFIFALENSDNVRRKMNSIHEDLEDMRRTLTRDNHNFIHKRVGESPQLMKPIKLKGENKQA